MVFLNCYMLGKGHCVTINWYPGHMAKARRQLTEQLRLADVVVEVCDARIPLSSRNPDLDQMTAHKQRILLMNKADLANKAATDRWLSYLQGRGISAYALNANRSARTVLPLIEKAAAQTVARAMQRGIRKTVRAMVVGVPNVGKSTIINGMKGRATLLVADRPGVTRSTQWFKVGPYLELMDSPGLLWPKLEDRTAARRLAYIGSIRDEVLDAEKLAVQLLDELMIRHSDLILARYKLSDGSLRGEALLHAICRARGFLIKGGELDIERGVTMVLDEFRGGVIGKITLEMPPNEAENV